MIFLRAAKPQKEVRYLCRNNTMAHFCCIATFRSYTRRLRMSEQIPNILVTLTVFNTSVAIYSNDLRKNKKHDIKKNKEN